MVYVTICLVSFFHQSVLTQGVYLALVFSGTERRQYIIQLREPCTP